MVETSSVPPRKSSVIFACAKNVRKRSSLLRNNFGKSSEIFGKSSKTSSLVCFCNKQNIICPLVDRNFIFSGSARYLTSRDNLLSECQGSRVNCRGSQITVTIAIAIKLWYLQKYCLFWILVYVLSSLPVQSSEMTESKINRRDT